MKRVWKVRVALEVEGEEGRQICFDVLMMDEDGRDHIVEEMLVAAVRKGFQEVRRAHRVLTVGEE